METTTPRRSSRFHSIPEIQLSARPLRSLRLCGRSHATIKHFHRIGAEIAEDAQRVERIQQLKLLGGTCRRPRSTFPSKRECRPASLRDVRGPITPGCRVNLRRYPEDVWRRYVSTRAD